MLGLYAGGTLAGETAHMMREALELPEEEKAEGYVLKTGACEILDLGDDLYTRGKPHPMMDPQARDEKMAEMVRAIRRPVLVLTDVILGYGAAGRPAEGLAKAIRELVAEKKQSREQAAFFVHVLGTRQDVQGLEEQVRMLKEAGACVFTGNTEMVRAALKRRISGTCAFCTSGRTGGKRRETRACRGGLWKAPAGAARCHQYRHQRFCRGSGETACKGDSF